MSWETITLDRLDEGIGVVTFNRPKVANAMNQHMLMELAEICDEIKGDQRLRSVIVTGAGTAFSSGFDLKAQAMATPRGVKEWAPVLEADFNGIMSFWNLPIPTIAAVNGPALAGGFELMMACDLAISVSHAVFGEPELKFGAGIVAMLLPWFVSPKIAKGVIFTGEDAMTAEQALQWGLINRIVDGDALMDEAIVLARKLAKMDPIAMRRTKEAMHRTYDLMGLRSALRAALDIDIMIEGEGTELKRDFLEIVREKGLGKALAWREERAGESIG